MRLMDSSKKLGMFHCIYFGVIVYNLQILLLLSLKIVFVLANSVDNDKMSHFIWVFTVCKSSYFGVTIIQRVKHRREVAVTPEWLHMSLTPRL